MTDKLRIVCGHCGSVVGVARDRLRQTPRCPSCHNPLFDGKPLTLTTATFDKHVGRSDLPLVVDFWAPWCGPCISMAPFYETTARQMEPALRFAKLNTEDDPAPASRFSIRSIPTLILFNGGRELVRQSGAMDVAGLTRWLTSALATLVDP